MQTAGVSEDAIGRYVDHSSAVAALNHALYDVLRQKNAFLNVNVEHTIEFTSSIAASGSSRPEIPRCLRNIPPPNVASTTISKVAVAWISATSTSPTPSLSAPQRPNLSGDACGGDGIDVYDRDIPAPRSAIRSA